MRQINPEVLKRRNNIIIDLFNEGFTVAVIGKALGLSRERVCQLIYKMTGISPREHRLEAKLKATLKSLTLIKVKCKNCKNDFIPDGANRVYCSRVCGRINTVGRQRMRSVTYKCHKCKKDYHPFRATVIKHRAGKIERTFCSTKCYKGYEKN